MEFTKFGTDACLCDRCFRFLDRRAAARDMSKPGAGSGMTGGTGGEKEEKVKKCLIRTCNRPVTGSVSKKWLNRLKKRLMKKVELLKLFLKMDLNVPYSNYVKMLYSQILLNFTFSSLCEKTMLRTSFSCCP